MNVIRKDLASTLILNTHLSTPDGDIPLGDDYAQSLFSRISVAVTEWADENDEVVDEHYTYDGEDEPLNEEVE